MVVSPEITRRPLPLHVHRRCCTRGPRLPPRSTGTALIATSVIPELLPLVNNLTPANFPAVLMGVALLKNMYRVGSSIMRLSAGLMLVVKNVCSNTSLNPPSVRGNFPCAAECGDEAIAKRTMKSRYLMLNHPLVCNIPLDNSDSLKQIRPALRCLGKCLTRGQLFFRI